MSVRVWCEDLMTGVLSSGIMEIRRLVRLVVLRLHKETPRDNCKAVQASIASASSSFHAFPPVPERAYSIHILFLDDHPTRPSKLHHTTLHGAPLPYQAPLPPRLEVEQHRGGRHPAHTQATHLFPRAHSQP